MMDTSRILPKQPSKILMIATRVTTAFFAAGVAFFLIVGAFLVGERIAYAGRALPGVRAAGIELSGMSAEQIESALALSHTYPQTGLIVLRDGDRMWMAQPAELGVRIDTQTMAAQALAVGRQGGLVRAVQEQIDAWYIGQTIAPIIIFDHVVGGSYLQGLAGVIDQPMQEATLAVDGTEIIVQTGQVGRELDIHSVLEMLEEPVRKFHDAEIPLDITESPPLVLDASAQADLARDILSAPLTLTVDDAESWVIEPFELAPMLRFTLANDSSGAGYDVALDPQTLMHTLEPLMPELERGAQNARFIFNDDTRELDLLQSAVQGRVLDIPATVEAINAGLISGEHSIPLAFEIIAPTVGDDATASELGISEAVSVVSTYFSGSSAGRIQNIKIASSEFHGLLVAPGETLSMAGILGDISLDNGYAEALIIYGKKTIKGVGGGVCQVSTTLFRAAFFGGYPINERHPHAYRVGYYEKGPGTPGTGLDATVFVPMVDLKFTNDSPNWLLLETYVYGNQLLWKFYSTSDGRSVTWSRDIDDEVEAADPLYKENRDLDKGEIEQVEWKADGMDVVIDRTVERGGETLFEDTFKTHYLPWRAVYEYGPGTDLPDGAITE
jgi:vancomycin resistance protein YoaR